jgi:3-oxoacyl-[acyl-carrier-protein] synthase III
MSHRIESVAVRAGAPVRDRAWFESRPEGRSLLSALGGRATLAAPLPWFETEREYLDALEGAALEAIARAGRTTSDIGLVVGCALGAETSSPDPLYRTHADLGLSPRAPVMIVRGELTNLLDALAIATSSGPAWDQRARLVLVGARMSQWARRLHHPLALFTGDAVTAMVVGPGPGLELVGFETEVLGARSGAMKLALRGAPDGRIEEEISLDADGERVFAELGPTVPVGVARRLLERFSIESGSIALAPNQTSPTLFHGWRESLGARELFTTFETLGNAGPASVGANLDAAWRTAEAEHILAVQLGWGVHFTTALFARGGTRPPVAGITPPPRR